VSNVDDADGSSACWKNGKSFRYVHVQEEEEEACCSSHYQWQCPAAPQGATSSETNAVEYCSCCSYY
jgi:hypothetical protein